MKLISAEQMRTLDKRTIEEYGTPGDVLMERAGRGATDYLLEYLDSLDFRHVKRLIFLTGKGNNGGDAFVMVRYLVNQLDVDIEVWTVCQFDELKGDAALNAKRLPEDISVIYKPQLAMDDFEIGDILIDALLGTGIKGELKAPYDNWIGVMNQVPYPVISLDIPSGLNGTTGMVATEAVKADLTIAMGLPKIGYTVADGPDYCGCLKQVGIGIPSDYVDDVEVDYDMLFEHDIKPFLRALPVRSHKGSQGRVLIIGGSQWYRGAPFLSGKSALKSGAGLVFLAVPEADIPMVSRDYSLIVNTIEDNGKGFFTVSSAEAVSKLIEQMDAIVIGPGMSNHPDCLSFMASLDFQDKPIVYDADALNLLAASNGALEVGRNAILTPHPGEMQRLLTGFALESFSEKTRQEQAQALADKLNAVVVLKGNQSIIAAPGNGRNSINSSGSAALATAGSGDVLAGMIGAWLTITDTVEDAAKVAVFCHGLAGELSPSGNRGLTADDLIDLIPQAMKHISPFA